MISAYATTVITLMGIWSIVALGLNVITGYAGQFNLGIGVYMGTGAYTAADAHNRRRFRILGGATLRNCDIRVGRSRHGPSSVTRA